MIFQRPIAEQAAIRGKPSPGGSPSAHDPRWRAASHKASPPRPAPWRPAAARCRGRASRRRRGTPDMALAMERGEIDGVCGWDWSSYRSQKPDWIRDNKANILMQVSLEPHPLLTQMGVPSVFQFVKGEEDRKVVELIVSQTVFHRSYIAPPDTPPAQLEVLRKAFDETVADPAFLADAEKLGLDIAPLPGAKVQDVVAKLYATPPAIVDRARKAIRPD